MTSNCPKGVHVQTLSLYYSILLPKQKVTTTMLHVRVHLLVMLPKLFHSGHVFLHFVRVSETDSPRINVMTQINLVLLRMRVNNFLFPGTDSVVIQ